MQAEAFLQHLLNGLTLGGMFALIAIGYTLVYGIIELINFAHGEIVTFGAFVGLGVLMAVVGTPLAGASIALPLAFLAAMVVTAGLGVTLERVAYRPLRASERLTALISALGASIFLMNAMMLAFGRDSKPFPAYLSGPVFQRGDFVVRELDVFLAAVTLILCGLLDQFVRRTRLGRAMRSVAQDPEAARMCGVSVNTTVSLTFLLGSALGAAAGILNGLYYGVIRFDMGFILGIKAFTAAVLGGIGNVRGAMVGGFVLGLSESLIPAILAAPPFSIPEIFDYKDAVAFAILILVLLAKPSGLLGEEVPEKA
ncbi:branched-chain amino acid ABC transporter permease [bacterium]|nr:branched-chain amino acid ABC transporter permease [bacterium]